MRQKFRRADGTEVEIEGTPEELAEYERKIREGQKPVSVGKKRPPVLRGAAVDDKELTDEEVMLVRLHRMGVLPKKETEQVFIPYVNPTPTPYWLSAPCMICGQYNCMQNHIWCGTSTGAKISLNTDSTVENPPLLQQAVDGALASFALMNKGWTPPAS